MLCVVWRLGWTAAARLVGCPMGEQTKTEAGPSRLNELAKTVANCQSTGTSQAQQSRQHKQDFDLDLEIYSEQLLTSNLRVCC